jgi:hypothetical protein
MDSIRDEIVTCMGGMYPFVGIQIPISFPFPIQVTGSVEEDLCFTPDGKKLLFVVRGEK